MNPTVRLNLARAMIRRGCIRLAYWCLLGVPPEHMAVDLDELAENALVVGAGGRC